tara:strand:+ start:93 stop:347 length:255 start_codon:yes stop_codon:yes gene_type:complete
MNIKTLELVRAEIINQKLKSECNLEYILMDENINPEEKVSKLMVELDKLKNSSLKLTFWEDFINNNVIIPHEGNKKTKKDEQSN